jgi:site-specific recombinase XerD
VIWETVRHVAGRANVRSLAHALRAAFAVRFDEAHPDQLLTLKDLLGHARLETTLVYLRRRKKQLAMERVRDLSWGSVGGLQPNAGEAHTGFEPVPPP